jgi:hypothetical protein
LATLILRTALTSRMPIPPDKSDVDQTGCPGEASPAGWSMVADELAAATFTAAILFAVVFFPVSG